MEEKQPEQPPRTGADLLALWEQEEAFLPREDLADSTTLARQLREQSQQVREQDRGRA